MSSCCTSSRQSRRQANNKILEYKNIPRSHTSSPGFIEVLNTSCSSCSSGKDQERASLSNGGGRHRWEGTTNSNMHQAGGMRADGADQNRSECMSYNTHFLLSSTNTTTTSTTETSPTLTFTPETLHCSLSDCNLVSFTSHTPLLSHFTPTYITYAKCDDTVYSRVGGSHVESRHNLTYWSRSGPFSTTSLWRNIFYILSYEMSRF